MIHKALLEHFVLELLLEVLPDFVQVSLVGILSLLLKSLVLSEQNSLASRFVQHVGMLVLRGWLDYLNIVLSHHGHVSFHPSPVLFFKQITVVLHTVHCC